MKVCGIDEAGRGPVIGPMVICGVMAEERDIPKLRELGVKDSKMLSPMKRERIAEQLMRQFKYSVQIITPKEIDEALQSKSMNLNWLEAVRSAMIINDLSPDSAILDGPGNNLQAYENYVRTYLKNKGIQLRAEHKADAKYEVASAASIIAKVTRDREVKAISAAIGLDVGSGYPADPKTKQFLIMHGTEHPEIIRQEWATVKKSQGNRNLSDF